MIEFSGNIGLNKNTDTENTVEQNLKVMNCYAHSYRANAETKAKNFSAICRFIFLSFLPVIRSFCLSFDRFRLVWICP